jgi:hypothetical protein
MVFIETRKTTPLERENNVLGVLICESKASILLANLSMRVGAVLEYTSQINPCTVGTG